MWSSSPYTDCMVRCSSVCMVKPPSKEKKNPAQNVTVSLYFACFCNLRQKNYSSSKENKAHHQFIRLLKDSYDLQGEGHIRHRVVQVTPNVSLSVTWSKWARIEVGILIFYLLYMKICWVFNGVVSMNTMSKLSLFTVLSFCNKLAFVVPWLFHGQLFLFKWAVHSDGKVNCVG